MRAVSGLALALALATLLWGLFARPAALASLRPDTSWTRLLPPIVAEPATKDAEDHDEQPVAEAQVVPLPKKGPTPQPACAKGDTFADRNGQLPRNVTLLIVGDSVDRYMIVDWCRKRKHRLRYSCGALGSDKKRCGPFTAFTESVNVHSTFAWVACRDDDWGVSIMLAHNRLAVDPSRTGSCAEGIPHFEQLGGANGAWRSQFIPILKGSVDVLGKPPDNVLVQSAYWDMLKLKGCSNESFWAMNLPGAAAEAMQRTYLDQWQANATLLFEAVLDSFADVGFPIRWAGWRTSNKVNADGQKWRYPRINELLMGCNERGKRVAAKFGADVFDLLRDGDVPTRDGVHPAVGDSALATDRLIRQIASCPPLLTEPASDAVESGAGAPNAIRD